MMLAAMRPELFGPIIIAGSPLSYWQGVHGKYPMRYSGGLLGGSWLTALVGDLGARQIRRRVAGAEFREPKSVEYAYGPNNTISTPRSIQRRRDISASSAGGAAMSI